MKSSINVPMERGDKKDSQITVELTAVFTVWDRSGNGWIKLSLDNEVYWIQAKELKRVLRVMKGMK